MFKKSDVKITPSRAYWNCRNLSRHLVSGMETLFQKYGYQLRQTKMITSVRAHRLQTTDKNYSCLAE